MLSYCLHGKPSLLCFDRGTQEGYGTARCLTLLFLLQPGLLSLYSLSPALMGFTCPTLYKHSKQLIDKDKSSAVNTGTLFCSQVQRQAEKTIPRGNLREGFSAYGGHSPHLNGCDSARACGRATSSREAALPGASVSGVCAPLTSLCSVGPGPSLPATCGHRASDRALQVGFPTCVLVQ